MKLFIKIILFLPVIFIMSCFNDKEDCIYPMDIYYGVRVIGAGSSQYNGDYEDTGWLVNGYHIAEKSGTLYAIEFDTTYQWCIKDNDIIQYYAPGCYEEAVYNCPSFVKLNGDTPAPTLERIHHWVPTPCGF
jgi:hypothetical protein